MADTARAVFLSYASQDAEAAKRICDALRAAGIEVWFDQGELRGGDAWDQKIRRELHDCALFIPVISANTAARHEGYFRLEWDLADQRTHMIARNRAFIVPVCVDATLQTGGDTPESFQRVQWTRLPGAEISAAFVERVRRLLSSEGEGGSAPDLVPSAAASGPSSANRRPTVLVGAVASAALLVVGYSALERFNRSNPSVARVAPSIAVLPLANEGGEASEQYFSDGISEDLITALSQFQGLKVIGRGSAFKFRDSKEDSRSIAAKLGVTHLLEGSVRREGDMVRVSAHLVDADDGSTQWSEHYDRPYKDLFALQDEITRAVSGALRAKLLPSEHAAAQSDRPPGGSLEAYNAWLEGNFYHSRLSEAGFRKAIEYYTRATQIDPRYARAWSSLSMAWINLGNFDPAGAAVAHARARESAARALAVSPELAAAHRALGAVLLYVDFDWRGAEAEFRHALALTPTDGSTKGALAVLLATVGDLEPAAEFMQQAVVTDPLTADYQQNLAHILLALNRLDEAERAIRRAIELQPAGESNYQVLSLIEIQRGDANAALGAAQQEPAGPSRDFAVAYARQVNNDAAAADAALKTLIEKYAKVYPYGIAALYALRNNPKATFEWLDRAADIRDPSITNLLSDPFIRRYKDDPRFAAYCRKVRLPLPGETSAGKST